MSEQNVRVGVGCFLFSEDGAFLAMQRAGAHGAGSWSVPGGHQEWFETPEQTAVREVAEETGIILDPAHTIRLGYTNDIFTDENKHYITLFIGCMMPRGAVPQNMEPHKCTALDWWDGSADRRVFISLQNFLQQVPNPYDLYFSLTRQAQAA